MPLFRDNASRTSDPGNRCKLYLRHALLLALIRKKDNPAQGVLAAFFGIDQTTVSRYIPVMDAMLAGILPTADNISEEVAAAPIREDFKKIVPGSDGGEIFIDGTHCPVQRPSVKSVRRMKYSGKKKKFTNNTSVYTNRDGVVIGISKSTVGSVGDITLLKERPMPFGKWDGGDARSGPARIRQVPPLRRPRLPGNRRPPARAPRRRSRTRRPGTRR